jgi:hypothetical protein
MPQKEAVTVPEIPGMEGVVCETIRQKLLDGGVTHADKLWALVGEDAEQGLDDLAKKLGIPRETLIQILMEQGKREAGGGGIKVWSSLKRHGLDLAVISAAFLVLFLSLRAAGCLAVLRQPIGLQDEVVVANKTLEAGRVLQTEDLTHARMIRRHNHFGSADELKGLILTKQVGLGAPFHAEEVLRLQIVARRDIPSGTILSCDDLSYDWTPHQRDAVVLLGTLLNGRVMHPLRAGEVIQTKFVQLYKTADVEN